MNGLRLTIVIAVLATAAAGCQSARYVTKDSDHGVIAIPANTARFRRQAEKLMNNHFPEGFAVADEEPLAADASSAGSPGRSEWRITYYRVGSPGPPEPAPTTTAEAGDRL